MKADNLTSGLEEGEHGHFLPSTQPRFALSEAGLQQNHTGPQPHVTATPHVGLTVCDLSEVVTSPGHTVNTKNLGEVPHG